MFGLTGAAFATTSVGKTTIETVTDQTIKPLEIALVEPGMRADLRADCDPLFSPSMNVQKGRLYCAQEFQRVDNTIPFFQYDRTVPWAVRPAMYADTNLYQACRLYAPESFAIKQVGVDFSPTCDPKDRCRFIDHSAVEVWIGQKNYFRAPLSQMFGVGEPSWQRPFPEFPVKGMIDLLPLPLIIEHQLHFWGQIVTKPWNYSKRIRCWLVYEGLHARGMQ